MKVIDSFVVTFLLLFASMGFCIVMVATAAVELSKKQSAKTKEPIVCQCQCADKEIIQKD